MKRARACSLVLCVILVVSLPSGVTAQDTPRLDVGINLTMATIRELDATELGISGRVGWRLFSMLGVEGELGFYPQDVPDRPAITASRTEAVIGVTVGPRMARVRPFARIRPGMLRVAAAPAPVACILIYPPPLSCTLAGGQTLFVLDAGGGIEFDVSPTAFVRVDVGDRLSRYPGPAISRERAVRDDSFYGHDLRVALGAGWRF